MAGPSLQLNITAPGQKSVEASVAAVRELAAALRGLPAAGAALAALQKQLGGVQAPSGLKTGTTDLKELVGEIKNLGAQLNTSFGSLEQTIKDGWKKAANAEAAGEAQLKSRAGKSATEIAEKQRQAIQNRSAVMTAAYAEQQAREASALEAAEARRAARENRIADGQAARAERQRQAIQNRSALMATAQAEGAAKEAAAAEAKAAKLLAAAAKLDAAYAAMDAKGQARRVLAGRSQLDSGIAPEAVRASVGPNALAAAQATTLAQAYGAVHDKVRPVNEQMLKGAPAVKAYGDATRDLQAGLRGLASGFGQVSLIASSVIPLLAGTALSKGFTSSIRIGADVRQDLETIRVLSEESESAVAGLEKQLVSLGQNGPFGPRSVAEAMKVLSLAGLSAAEVAQALKPALDFAVTGGVGIEKAAESLVAIGTAYSFQAGEFGTVADAVAKAAAISMSSVEGMMESFRASSMIAQGYGVTLKDTAVQLAILANVGIRGSAAGTALRQMYSELSGASRVTKKAMEDLKVDVVDATTGTMKPAIQIVLELATALDKLTPRAQVSAIQAISNERGGKGLIADLAAFRTAAKEAGTTAETELGRIKKLIDESAGFDAIAASKLNSTPLNLMKGVGASLETALYEAFTAIEPTLTVLAAKVRETFNSYEFRGGLTTLIEGMAAFTKVVVENVAWLQTLGQAFLVFKGLQALQTALAGGAAAMAFLQTSSLGAAMGVTQTAVAAGAAVAPLTGMAAGARVLSLALGFLGPLTIAIGLAALAWQTYAEYQARAQDISSAALVKQENTLDALQTEAKRLREVNEALDKGIALREAEALAKANADRLGRASTASKEQAPKEKALADAQADLDREMRLNGGKGRPMAVSNYREILQRAQVDLDNFKSQFANNEAQIAIVEAQVRADSQRIADRQAARVAQRPKGGTEGWNTKDPKAAAMQASQDAGDLQQLQKTFQDKQSLAQTAYKREMELLEISRKGQLISEAKYASSSERLSAQLYDNEMANLSEFIAQSAAKIEALETGPKASRAKGAVDQIELERRKAEEELAFLQRKNKEQQAARQNLASVAIDTGIDKVRESVDLEAARLATALQWNNLAPREIAAQQAMNDVRAKGNEILRKTVDQLAAAEAELATASSTFSEEEFDRNPAVRALQTQALRLRASLADAQMALEAQAQRSGGVAAQKADLENKPTWLKFIQEGQNAMTVLRTSRDEFMNGWVEGGRTIWATWLETGKVSFKSLGQLLTKTLADISYKRFIAEPFSKVGEGVFDRLLKPVATVQGGVTAEGAAFDLREAFQGLGSTAESLSGRLGGLGQDFWNLFVQAGQGLAAMLQTSGSGSGFGNFLGSLFSGGNTSTGNQGGNINDPWANGGNYALGGAFSNGVQAFAKGAMMNSVISQPHYFKYGGNKLGVAGEAGPEAIMPLSRASNGELGVRVQSSAPARSGPMNQIIIENHGGGPEPTVSTQSRPDGSELTRVVIGEVAKDIARGGQVRSAQRKANTKPRY